VQRNANKKKRPHWRPRHRWKNDINAIFKKEVLSEETGLVWANVTQDRGCQKNVYTF